MSKRRRAETIDHIENGGIGLELTKTEMGLMKKGAVITARDICCDCGLEHLLVYEMRPNGNIIQTVFRDDVATKKNRRKK